MPKAEWNGVVIAEAPTVEKVEGNLYFPPDALKSQYFKPSSKSTVCPWKVTTEHFFSALFSCSTWIW
jgi:uncharacterized protein (DUF427 family)